VGWGRSAARSLRHSPWDVRDRGSCDFRIRSNATTSRFRHEMHTDSCSAFDFSGTLAHTRAHGPVGLDHPVRFHSLARRPGFPSRCCRCRQRDQTFLPAYPARPLLLDLLQNSWSASLASTSTQSGGATGSRAAFFQFVMAFFRRKAAAPSAPCPSSSGQHATTRVATSETKRKNRVRLRWRFLRRCSLTEALSRRCRLRLSPPSR
jgi:hypothetical protein